MASDLTWQTLSSFVIHSSNQAHFDLILKCVLFVKLYIMLIWVTVATLEKKVYRSGHVYWLLNQYFNRRCQCFTQATHRQEKKNQSAQMKVVQGDYLASNRVLTPTLRLKPFSIMGISADVAPASPYPLELPASCSLCVCRFTASLLGHSVRPPDQQRVTGDPGMAPIQTRILPQPMQGDPD